jgi:hypothetical protein
MAVPKGKNVRNDYRKSAGLLPKLAMIEHGRVSTTGSIFSLVEKILT